MAETIYAASSKVKVRLSHKLGWGARILRNADFQSAVSQNFILLVRRNVTASGTILDLQPSWHKS